MMSKIGFAPFLKNVIILCSFVSIIGCAEIGAPPGGEVDKVKPRILSSTPVNGSTQVAIDNQIIISFSERITKPTTQRPIYISPRLESEPDIKWKSDNVTITLADSFQIDQTYIISFAEGLTDLRRNPIDSGSIIAFTTGDKLATGLIDGFVVDENNIPKPKTVVALYDNELFKSSGIDSLYPLYMGVSSVDGYFSFQYIPDGDYQIVAFTDNNQNDLYDSDKELFGLPYKRTTLDSTNKQIKKLTLALTSEQIDSLMIISARQTDNNLFSIQFNQNILTRSNFDLSDASLTMSNYSDSSQEYFSTFINASDSTNPQLISAYFGELPIGNYKLILDVESEPLVFDSVRVKELNDNKAPFIQLFRPRPIRIFKDSLNMFIQFSEPIDTTQISPETFYFLDADSNLVLPKYSFVNASLCQFTGDFITEEINSYVFNISEFDILDMSGNQMGDSTTKHLINFINNDSLGVVKGFIQSDFLFSSDVVQMLQFENITTQQKFSFVETSSSFKMELPQGKYLLSGFIDINNNGRRDFGSLSLFEFAEPFSLYPDTINIRARFESTDIQLEFK